MVLQNVKKLTPYCDGNYKRVHTPNLDFYIYYACYITVTGLEDSWTRGRPLYNADLMFYVTLYFHLLDIQGSR